MTEWFSAQQFAGLPGLPTTDRAIRSKAQRDGWQARKRIGSKAMEYHISSLPAQTQQALHPEAINPDGGAWRMCITVDAAAVAAGFEISIKVGGHD